MYKKFKNEGKILYSNKKQEFHKIVGIYIIIFTALSFIKCPATYAMWSIQLGEILPWDIMFLRPTFEINLVFNYFLEILTCVFFFCLIGLGVDQDLKDHIKSYFKKSFLLGSILFIFTKVPLYIYTKLNNELIFYENPVIKYIIVLSVIIFGIFSCFFYFAIPISVLEENGIFTSVLKSFRVFFKNISGLIGFLFSFLPWFLSVIGIKTIVALLAVYLEVNDLSIGIFWAGITVETLIQSSLLGLSFVFYPVYYLSKLSFTKEIN